MFLYSHFFPFVVCLIVLLFSDISDNTTTGNAMEHETINETMDNEEIVLPDLFIDVLNEIDIRIYFESLQACQTIECRAKGGAMIHAEDTLSLELCTTHWLNNTLYSVQVIYEWEGATWCDTLSRVEEGTRIVRIKRGLEPSPTQ